MRVVSSNEMKKIEQISIDEYGLDQNLIIENIGIRGADFIEQAILHTHQFGEIIVMVGNGNNGSDGLAIARHLKNRGYIVRAFTLFSREASKDTKEFTKQLALAENFGVKISDVEGTDQIQAYFTQTQNEYLVIDAIMGTGVRLPLSNFIFDIVELVNRYATITVSVDIPTGVTGENGATSGNAIMANFTLAIGLPKTGHYTGEGAVLSGEVVVLDSGIPEAVLKGGDKFLLSTSSQILEEINASRNRFSHKSQFGHTLVVGGSTGMTGAVILASEAALNVGSGLVTASTWSDSYSELCSRVATEILIGLIPQERCEIELIIKDLKRWDSIVIGPGLGRTKRAREIVLEALNHFAGPIVVDADAIRLVSLKEDLAVFRDRKFPTILTPHFGEFADFVGASKEEIMKNPIEYLKEAVDTLNCSIILKGPCSYVGFPSGECYINYFPNDGMATAGSGDVLSGILAGLLAQATTTTQKSGIFLNQDKIKHAICYGLTVHTLAGKYALEKLGARSMSASEIVNNLSEAFLELEKKYLE